MSIREEAEELRKKIEEEQKEKLKIALFGQPGAGKSSLINEIVGEPVAKSGASTDVTTEAQIIPYGDLVLVDLPGYGTSTFPANDWFDEFKPHDYDLFLCVFSGKFHEADSTFFRELKESGRVCLFVRNKCDDLWEKNKTTEQLEEEIRQDVHRQVDSKEKVYFVSCKNNKGLDLLVNGIQEALDPAKRYKYARTAKAFTTEHLEAKKVACEKMVLNYSALAAANGINPIPGLDIGVDITLMLKLFTDIRDAYGLSDEKINSLAPSLLALGKKIIDFTTIEGILLLLKRFAATEVTKEISKYIPIVGQAVAAAAGFGMTYLAGTSYLNDCHELADKILQQELSYSR